ncbi:Histone-lysine N-methyltransferase KMT5B [Varanus komodoensis]|nr:Histone-lysine N-methyltransferase KMT5B [Varanus komodoensis]
MSGPQSGCGALQPQVQRWLLSAASAVPQVRRCASQCSSAVADCANAFTACSPSKSRCSSSSLNQDQDEVPPHSNKKKQTDPEADKINYLKNVFNIFTSLPSPDRKDRGSGDNLSENAEASNESYVYPLDETVDALPLGSVALLLEEEEESHGGIFEKRRLRGDLVAAYRLHFDEEAVVTSLQNIRGIEESEGRKETQEWLIDQPKSLATSSTQKKHLESLVSLEAVKRSMQRNVIDVEPEDECEFVIEESFGVPSTFWISASQKKEKPQKNILTEASSRGEKRIKHDSVKKVGQASKKLVAGTPVKQSKTKVAKVAERTSDRLKNASRNKEILTMVEYQSKLAVSANKEVRKQMDSKEKASGINNESCGDSASRNQSEDLASLLEEGDDFSVQPQPLRNTAQAQEPSQSEQCMRQKCSKVTPLAEIRKEAFQYFTNRDVYSEELIEDHHFSKVALPVQSIAEQLPCSKKSVKQICSKMKPSVEKLNKDRQECGIISLSSEVCLNSRDANKHSEDQLSVLKPITIIGPAAQQSSHTKSVRKQKPSDISLPEKQIKTRSNNVKRSVRGTRKKSKVLVLEESSESRHEEDQCDAGGKSFHKIRTNKAQKTPSALVSLEENDYGNISDEQNPCEQCAAEIRLNASKDQQSSNMHPLQ